MGSHRDNLLRSIASQRALLDIMDEVLQEKYGVKLAQCGDHALVLAG